MSIGSSTAERVTTITLNRPEKLNAFGGTMREDLLAALERAEADGNCRVVVITGAGRAFCAGGDVELMAGLRERDDARGLEKLLAAGAAIVMQIVSMSKPVVAAINGVAAGAGCNLALACDYRIASDAAQLAESFIRIGLHPDWGGTWLLPRLVGPGRALELMMSGRAIEATEALSIGMVDRVVPAATFPQEVAAIARMFADAPLPAAAGIKRALRESERNDLRSQLALESEHQIAAFRSADAAERFAAFL
ncbi:MAG: enoyl-CoA hydratase/isomerase family protein, partial [Thermoanaerobaculia bacterium]